MIRVRTGRRLHFGLFAPVPVPELNLVYGGVGCMVDAPGVELQGEPSAVWQVEGPQSDRVRELLHGLRDSPHAPKLPQGLRIRMISVPPAHQGWGTGTQLALAVARIWAHYANTPWSAKRAAEWMGRGKRSAIGIAGFDRPGLLIDPGKTIRGEPHGEVQSITLPPDWTWILLEPEQGKGLHGEAESHALQRLPSPDLQVVRSLMELGMEILPQAAKEQEFSAFAQALTRYNRLAGSLYRTIQGGDYCSLETENLLHSFQEEGIQGIGQSSWGPGLFALFPEIQLARRFVSDRPVPGYRMHVCQTLGRE